MLHISNARRVAGVLIIVLLTACSTQQTRDFRNTLPAGLPAHAELNNVVFYPQEEHQCGPASLAMVLQNSGVNVEPQQLKDYLYIPDKQGSLQIEMLATARRLGLLTYVLQPGLQDVLTEVAAGNPVVVLQNLGLSWYPIWHYAVVIGYDLVNDEIILRSGLEQRQVLPIFTFENTWARSKHWAMVALPPTRLPQTSRPEILIQSIEALQHSSAAIDVWPVYALAMQRWPDSLPVKIAAGNHAYNHGNPDLAEQLFLKATQDHPDSAAAFNNLAQTLSDVGKHEAALLAIRRALEIGGPLEPAVRKTLFEIEQRKRETLK